MNGRGCVFFSPETSPICLSLKTFPWSARKCGLIWILSFGLYPVQLACKVCALFAWHPASLGRSAIFREEFRFLERELFGLMRNSLSAETILFLCMVEVTYS